MNDEDFLVEINKRTKRDREWNKIWEKVFDHYTLHNLFKSFLKSNIEGIEHQINLGKEAVVFKAITRDKEPRAIKIYRVETSDFKNMEYYIKGDPRFRDVPKNKRRLIEMWCRKEFRNLIIAKRAGVSSPKPYSAIGNVLVMDFIGDEWPAPKLKDANISNIEKVYKSVISDMKKLYQANLVHSDLSEFNILYWRETPWLIDFAQGMVLSHPKSHELLKRDVRNVANFFLKKGIKTTAEDILNFIKS